GTPRRGSHRRRARSRAGRTFSRQVRLGQVGGGAAEDLFPLLTPPDLLARLTQLRRLLTGLAGTVAVIDVGLADPFVERHLVDAEVLRDLRDGDAVLTGPGHSHDVFAELLGVGSGHGAHPSRPPSRQARSDVTHPCGSPHELLRKAIARVPAGNDYVIVDRCAGSGNLIEGLTDEELSHVIVNTYEQFEYLELAREYGDRVRAVIPPTYKAGDPALGVLLNGDALSDRFVLGLLAADGSRVPNEIHKHVDNPDCTVILFENPPYADAAGVESNVSGKKKAFGWQASWVKAQMAAEPAISRNGTKPLRDLTNLFIWSAFKYYLRQPTDSYVVFSPSKYFKSQGL